MRSKWRDRFQKCSQRPTSRRDEISQRRCKRHGSHLSFQPGEQVEKLLSPNPSHIRVSGVADAKVVPEESAAARQHSRDFTGDCLPNLTIEYR